MQEWAEQTLPKIVDWIRNIVTEAGARGVILGLSGGLDSSTSCGLLARALGSDRVLGVAMPCHSISQDFDHARRVAEAFGVQLTVCDLTETYDALLRHTGPLDGLAAANIRPRLRMTTLYALGQQRGYLVCGNGNKAEWMTGYFTKFGDSGCDFLPLLSFTKTQVRALARALGVPGEVIDKAPSAGLWPGQTDEAELGVTYDQVDSWLQGEELPQKAKLRLEELKKRSAHKRSMPPFFME